jgi:hypothetical protein
MTPILAHSHRSGMRMLDEAGAPFEPGLRVKPLWSAFPDPD